MLFTLLFQNFHFFQDGSSLKKQKQITHKASSSSILHLPLQPFFLLAATPFLISPFKLSTHSPSAPHHPETPLTSRIQTLNFPLLDYQRIDIFTRHARFHIFINKAFCLLILISKKHKQIRHGRLIYFQKNVPYFCYEGIWALNY